MAISQVAGQMLKSTLQRDGANLAFKDTANSTPVLFLVRLVSTQVLQLKN